VSVKLVRSVHPDLKGVRDTVHLAGRGPHVVDDPVPFGQVGTKQLGRSHGHVEEEHNLLPPAKVDEGRDVAHDWSLSPGERFL